MQLFHNRREAAYLLAQKLQAVMFDEPQTLVIALTPGGVLVGSALSRSLRAEFEVLLVRELELRAQPGLSVGALVSGGLTVLDDEVIQSLNVSEAVLDDLMVAASEDIRRKERFYRSGRPPLPVTGRTVILTDDGSASGAALMAAGKSMRLQSVRRLAIAVPVATPQIRKELAAAADEVVCVATPANLGSVDMCYGAHEPVGDEDVRRLLEEASFGAHTAFAGSY